MAKPVLIRKRQVKRTFLERLELSRRGPDECWPWNGHLDKDGYGHTQYGGVPMSAHKASYLHFVGPLDAGVPLDHVAGLGCTMRSCINPRHLEPVTTRENVMRSNGVCAVNARKLHCNRGHLLSGDNVEMRPDGRGKPYRNCRACVREHSRLQRERQRGRPIPAGYMVKSQKTHCPQGHAMVGYNLALRPDGRGHLNRCCRTCERDRARAYHERKRQERAHQ